MSEKLNMPNRIERVSDDAREELTKECLRKAEDIRRGLEGRQHSDSTALLAEDRKPAKRA